MNTGRNNNPLFLKTEVTYNRYFVHWEDYARQPERFLCEYYTIFKTLSPSGKYSPGCLSGLKVLDLGCGNGDFSIECLRLGAEFVIGVDLAENQVIRAREISRSSGFAENRYLFLKGNVYQSETIHNVLPLDEYGEKVDIVLLLWIMDYARSLEDYAELLNLATSYLKPGGTLYIMQNNHAIAVNTEEVRSKNKFGTWDAYNPKVHEDHWQIDCAFFNSETGEEIWKELLEVYSKEQCETIMRRGGLTDIESGPLRLDPKYKDLGYKKSDFYCLTQEIGAYYYYKGIKNKNYHL